MTASADRPADRQVSSALASFFATDVGSRPRQAPPVGDGDGARPDGQDRRSVTATVAAMLDRFGILDVATRDDLETVATAVLTDRGHDDVAVAGLRWKTLTVTCPPSAAALLRIDAQQLQADLAARFPDQIARVVVSVRPPARVQTRHGAQPSEVAHGAPPPTDRP